MRSFLSLFAEQRQELTFFRIVLLSLILGLFRSECICVDPLTFDIFNRILKVLLKLPLFLDFRLRFQSIKAALFYHWKQLVIIKLNVFKLFPFLFQVKLILSVVKS
jgi:hypothetical protein